MVENFKSLQHLSHLVPARCSPHPIQKSSVIPIIDKRRGEEGLETG